MSDFLEFADVVIVGGGIAGLTLALELGCRVPSATVQVIERATYPVPETIHKVGESTVEIAGHYLRDVLGLGEHLRTRQLNKFGLRVFFSNGDNTDVTARAELGHSQRPPDGVGTYQIDRGRLENALSQELIHRGGHFLSGTRVLSIDLGADGTPNVVHIADANKQTRTLCATWVIDATGRSGLLKRRLQLAKPVDHGANAVWFRLAYPIDIDDWSEDSAWLSRVAEGRRELSTNHLMGDGYWVWLIRLASGSTSIGIVTDAAIHPFDQLNTRDHALQWLRDHEPQCAAVVDAHLDDIQDFRLMRDYSYSSSKVFSGEQKWCLTGESGVFLDPLYSPGLDLIAISNGLIVDLIDRARNGEDVTERAAVHNQMFMLIFDGWLGVYEDQYGVMGKPRVMITKVIWDTAVYWAVLGLLYFRDAIKDLCELPDIVASLARFSVAAKGVQRFFHEWASIETSTISHRFISFYDFDFMPRLHKGMTADLTDDELVAQFDCNVRFIEQLSGQMIATVSAEIVGKPDISGTARQLAASWATDPVLSALVNIYRSDNPTQPVGDGWITLHPSPPAQIGLRS